MKIHRVTHVLCSTLLLFLLGFVTPQNALADEPYIGEIRWVAFNFEPFGWAYCNGQLLSIAENTALFALIGTTFGGDGQTTFALPDLRSRAPIHVSNTYPLGGTGGEEGHTLTVTELPSHTHGLKSDPREATSASPTGNYPAKTSGGTSGYGSTLNATMAPVSIAAKGGNQPHENMKPFVTLNCVIALQGIFPSRN